MKTIIDQLGRPTRDDVVFFREYFGNKTINQVRTESGMPKVVGGDLPYADWIAQWATGDPTLTIVQ